MYTEPVSVYLDMLPTTSQPGASFGITACCQSAILYKASVEAQRRKRKCSTNGCYPEASIREGEKKKKQRFEDLR